MQPNTYLYAVLHWISWLILIGGGIGTARTFNPEVAIGTILAWVLWIFIGSRAEFFQRYVAIKNGKKSDIQRDIQSLQKQQLMSYEYKGRYRELEKTRKQILDAVKHLDVEIIKPELDKIEVLLDAFVRTAVAHKNVSKFLEDNPIAALSTERQKLDAQTSSDPAVIDNLRMQREMLDQRGEERTKVQASQQALAVQLDTIEKTLAYLKSKVTSFNTPAALQTEVASVITGIEAAERTLKETEKIEEEARRIAQLRMTT